MIGSTSQGARRHEMRSTLGSESYLIECEGLFLISPLTLQSLHR